jgi:tetratricopeptide (TPR) repeat protein
MLESTALPHLQALNRRFPNNPRVQSSLRTGLNKLGNTRLKLGRHVPALSAYRASLRLAESLVATDSTNKIGYQGLSFAYESIGNAYVEMGNTDDGIASFEHALGYKKALYNLDTLNAEAGNLLAVSHRSLCKILLETNRLERALDQCRQAVMLQETVVANDPKNALGRENLAWMYVLTARVHRAIMQKPSVPEPVYRQHSAETGDWYDKAVALYTELQRSGVTYDWSIHPDTLAAERGALIQSNR